MLTFLKGIVVGLGAVAPGLSGSILLVIFGLYQKIVSTVSHIFRDFKKNLLFLLPLFGGIGVGVVLFSILIKIPLEAFPMQTHYLFLGLILGTLPMLWREVTKEGFHPKYYACTGVAFVLGLVFFLLTQGMFPDITEPNFLQSFLLGLTVAAAYLVPGVDSFAILSAFGFYNLWINSISAFDFSVLLPAALGVAVGGVLISLIFNKLLSRLYTATYSTVFGLFLAVILNFIIKECERPSLSLGTGVSFVLFFVGLAASLVFSNLENILAKRRKK